MYHKIIISASLFLFAHSVVFGQEDYYAKSLENFREAKYDSATINVNKAINQFKGRNMADSLTLALVHAADIHWVAGSTNKALSVVDEALQQSRKLPHNHLFTVAALNKKGQIYVNNQQLKEGEKYMLDALSRINENQKPNGIYAAFYNNIAWMYLEKQQFSKGLEFGLSGKKMNEELFGKDARQLLGSYQTLLYLAHDAGKFDEAEVYGKELIRIASLNFKPSHPRNAMVHNDVSTLYQSMGRYEEALLHLQKMEKVAGADYKANGKPTYLAIAYNNLALLYDRLGEYYLSEQFYEKAAQLHKLHFEDNEEGMVGPLTHLANSKRMIGRYAESEVLFDSVYRMQKRIDGQGWKKLAYVESQYGDLYFERKQYAQAENFYHKAIENITKAGGDENQLTLATLSSLGETYSRTNRVKDALRQHNNVLYKYKQIYPAGHFVIAGEYNKISNAHLLGNETEKAFQYSDSTFLSLLQTNVLPSGNWLLQLPGHIYIISYLQNRLGILNDFYRKTGNKAYLEQLLKHIDFYSEYLEKILPTLKTQASVSKLSAQHKKVYNYALESCWEMYKQTKNAGYLNKSFGYAERSKALLLRMATNSLLVGASINENDKVKKRDLLFNQQIALLSTAFENSERKSDSLLSLLSNTISDYSLFKDSLQKTGNSFYRVRYNMHPKNAEEIRSALLRKNETLLEYAVTEQYVYCYILNRKFFKVFRQPVTILEDIKQIQDLFSLSENSFIPIAHKLYNNLLKPAEPFLLSKKIVVVPDGQLYYLNFEILLRKPDKLSFNHLDYQVFYKEFSYQLSATNAVLMNEVNAPENSAAMYLIPVFTDDMKAPFLPDATNNDYTKLLRQPFTLMAAEKISNQFKGKLFSKLEAEEAAFKKFASDYSIIHFGTHTEINNTSPLLSRMFLAKPPPSDSISTEDGSLFAHEIYGMNLNASMAILAACETGQGELVQGEGVMSLAHGFMYAGCKSVLMSLWKIDEKESADLIVEYYKYLSKGNTKSNALHKAKLQYLKQSNHRHPYFWAGMITVGNNENISTPYGKYFAVILILLLAPFLVYYVTKKRKNTPCS